MNVGIIGLGHVGLTLGLMMAKKGFTVYGIEKNVRLKENLRNGMICFHEPGLIELLKAHQGSNFFVVDQFSDLSLEALLITVGTPLDENYQCSCQNIEEALNEFDKIYDGSQLIVLRSTVAVGTSRRVARQLAERLEELGHQAAPQLVYAPERVVEGDALCELTTLPQIIGANNRAALARASAIFNKIGAEIVTAASLEEAEVSKLLCNVYRDSTFALANLFNDIAHIYGVDGHRAIEIAGHHYSRAQIPAPGLVGGSCLTKDTYLLAGQLDTRAAHLLLELRQFNEIVPDKILHWVKKHFLVGFNSDADITKQDNKICLSGMAFKGYPPTSDLRESPALALAHELKKAGFPLVLHDFVAEPAALEQLNCGPVFSGPLDKAAAGCALLIILNNHPLYASVNSVELERSLAPAGEILDLWGMLAGAQFNRVPMRTLGNFPLAPQAGDSPEEKK